MVENGYLKQLKQEYKQKLKDDPTQDGSNKAWKEYKKAVYDYNGDPGIFKIMTYEPEENAMDLFYSYILDEMTDKAFYRGIRQYVTREYVKNLRNANMTDFTHGHLAGLYWQLSCESMKCIKTLGKVTEKLTCRPDHYEPSCTTEDYATVYQQDVIGYIAWFNILERIHDHIGLPPVAEIGEGLRLPHQSAQGVFDTNDFDLYPLTPADVAYCNRLKPKNPKWDIMAEAIRLDYFLQLSYKEQAEGVDFDKLIEGISIDAIDVTTRY